MDDHKIDRARMVILMPTSDLEDIKTAAAQSGEVMAVWVRARLREAVRTAKRATRQAQP